MTITQTEEDKFVCSKPELTIITFDEIFKLVVIHLINTVYNIYGDMNLIKDMRSDIKKITVYAILDKICNRMNKERDTNSILYINTNFMDKHYELWTYTEKEKFGAFVIKTCKSVSRNAPIPILVETKNIELLNDCGETRETIHQLESALSHYRNKTTSLKKLKKYSKDNGLIQFMYKYYPEDSIKNSMFYNKYLKGDTNE